jgi:hypothetical protein
MSSWFLTATLRSWDAIAWLNSNNIGNEAISIAKIASPSAANQPGKSQLDSSAVAL